MPDHTFPAWQALWPRASPLICLDVDAPLLASQSADRITRTETKAMPENLCYVIYTSGTTEPAEGRSIEHRQAAIWSSRIAALWNRTAGPGVSIGIARVRRFR